MKQESRELSYKGWRGGRWRGGRWRGRRGGGETEKEKGEEPWHEDWEVNRAIEQEVNTCTQPQEVAESLQVYAFACVCRCLRVAATSIISITKREFHPKMEKMHRCVREKVGMLTEWFHTLLSPSFSSLSGQQFLAPELHSCACTLKHQGVCGRIKCRTLHQLTGKSRKCYLIECVCDFLYLISRIELMKLRNVSTERTTTCDCMWKQEKKTKKTKKLNVRHTEMHQLAGVLKHANQVEQMNCVGVLHPVQ